MRGVVECGKGESMNRLTLSEAEEMIADHMFGYGEKVNATTYEGGIYDMDISEARIAADNFIASLGREIDPLTIQIRPDRLEDMDIPCVAITINIWEAI